MYDRTNFEGVYSWIGRLAIVIMLILLVTCAVVAAEPLPKDSDNQMPEGMFPESVSVVCVAPPILKSMIEGFTMVFRGKTDYGTFNYLFASEDGHYYIMAIRPDGKHLPCVLSAGSEHELLGINEGDETDEEAE